MGVQVEPLVDQDVAGDDEDVARAAQLDQPVARTRQPGRVGAEHVVGAARDDRRPGEQTG
jgi:hypothetical protein